MLVTNPRLVLPTSPRMMMMPNIKIGEQDTGQKFDISERTKRTIYITK